MLSHPIIRPHKASAFLDAMAEGEAPDVNQFVETIGSEGVLDLQPIDGLVRKLTALRGNYPKELRDRDPAGGRFEREACVEVHSSLHYIERDVLASFDFWTYLAVARFRDLIEWRFGSPGQPADRKNYGIQTRTENLIYRLWLRGELGRSAGEDPYELAKTGDQDLWRSHIFRPGYGNVRTVAQTLLRLQAGKLIVDGSSVPRLSVEGIRKLAPRLSRLRANVMFEFLTPVQVGQLVKQLSSDLPRGK